MECWNKNGTERKKTKNGRNPWFQGWKNIGFVGKWKCGNGNIKYWNEKLIKWPRVSVGGNGNEIIIDLPKYPKVCRKDFNRKGSLVGLVVVTNSSYIVDFYLIIFIF